MVKKCPRDQEKNFVRHHQDAYAAFYTLEEISGKYRVLILTQLGKGPARFADLQRLTATSRGSLARILKELVDQKNICRISFPGNLPHVEYRLTQRGTKLLKIIQELSSYGQHYYS